MIHPNKLTLKEVKTMTSKTIGYILISPMVLVVSVAIISNLINLISHLISQYSSTELIYFILNLGIAMFISSSCAVGISILILEE